MSLILLGILNSQVAGGAAVNSFDHLASTNLSSNTASVTFNVSSYTDYKHLQIRAVLRPSTGTGNYSMRMRFNGATSNYKSHYLSANGFGLSSASNGAFTDGMAPMGYLGATSTTNHWAVGVIDIYDAFSSSKNTTVRSLNGFTDESTNTDGLAGMWSAGWFDTSAVTSIYMAPDSGLWLSGSRFYLYGLKGE